MAEEHKKAMSLRRKTIPSKGKIRSLRRCKSLLFQVYTSCRFKCIEQFPDTIRMQICEIFHKTYQLGETDGIYSLNSYQIPSSPHEKVRTAAEIERKATNTHCLKKIQTSSSVKISFAKHWQLAERRLYEFFRKKRCRCVC